MAEAIVTNVVSVIVKNLGSQTYKDFVFARDLNSYIKRVQELKTTIEATLLDAAALETCSNAQRDVLDKLSCALVELDDFFDRKAARAKQKEVMQGNKFVKAVVSFFSKSNQLVSPLRDAHKLKAIVKKLECIARDHVQFGAIINVSSANQTHSMITETIWSHVNTGLVIGRDRDRENIIRTLCEESDPSETLSVAAIVGIGGVGKTTLAQYVFHDNRVKSYFDVQFWISATQDFNVTKVLEKILESSTDVYPCSCKIDKLYDQFLQVIGGKKFLLVLDNIWEQEYLRVKWLKLRSLLTVGAKGSKILITTRFLMVAGIMDSTSPYMLGDLTEQDSWLLFQKIACTQWQEVGVEVIGKEIAKMCQNVPLVIQSIGSHLASKDTLEEWQTFRNNQLAHSSLYGRDIIQTLKLSYDQLDMKLKLCVAYCSLFPKGFRYDKDEMIRYWISLGYVEPQYRNQSVEEAGEAYVRSLVHCGFFQYEGITGITMHDLMHDLVLTIAGSKYKMVDTNTKEFDRGVCHVSFCSMSDTTWEVPSSFFDIEHLQSFLFAVPWRLQKTIRNFPICDRLFWRFSSLRILDLHDLGIEDVPRSLGELKCLRYLNLSWNPIVKLPNSITQLINLLSLDLSWCYKLQKLPKDISMLEKLRHIYVSGCDALGHMPKGLGNLTDLRTLDTFIVRQHMAEGLKASAVSGLTELNRLSNLTGLLKICVYGRSSDGDVEDWATNLKNLDKLMGLQLEFKDDSAKKDDMFLKGLRLNANLRELHIEAYGGDTLPSWVRAELHFWLPNLVKLWIYKCERCRSLCSLGRLPYLQNVLLGKLDNVEYIEDTCCGSSVGTFYMDDHYGCHAPLFPSLETLMLISMPKLKGWKRIISNGEEKSKHPIPHNFIERMKAFTKLKGLWVDNMDIIVSMTSTFNGLSSLEELTIAKCEDLKTIPTCIASLSNLKRLTLKNCSRELKEKCQKPSSEDWAKVQHIPCIIYLVK